MSEPVPPAIIPTCLNFLTFGSDFLSGRMENCPDQERVRSQRQRVCLLFCTTVTSAGDRSFHVCVFDITPYQLPYTPAAHWVLWSQWFLQWPCCPGTETSSLPLGRRGGSSCNTPGEVTTRMQRLDFVSYFNWRDYSIVTKLTRQTASET